MTVMMRAIRLTLAAVLVTTPVWAQTPQPFPRPGAPAAPAPRTQPAPPPPQASAPAAQAPTDPNAPTEAALGTAIYPSAQFLGSYDAGRGQRYYVFATTAAFAEVVGYYQRQTSKRGELVIKDPPTHQFHNDPFVDFDWDTMVFPPGVTVKDWTSGGLPGYPNPKRGAQPARFPTIVLIVTPPPAAPPTR